MKAHILKFDSITFCLYSLILYKSVTRATCPTLQKSMLVVFPALFRMLSVRHTSLLPLQMRRLRKLHWIESALHTSNMDRTPDESQDYAKVRSLHPSKYNAASDAFMRVTSSRFNSSRATCDMVSKMPPGSSLILYASDIDCSYAQTGITLGAKTNN